MPAKITAACEENPKESSGEDSSDRLRRSAVLGPHVQGQVHASYAAAIAKEADRGWRLDRNKSTGGNIDAAVALAIDGAGQKVERPQLLGWLG